MILSEPVISSISGSIGGMGAMAITYPLVIASTRDAVTEKRKVEEGKAQPKTSLLPSGGTILRIYNSEGLDGLYAGLSSSLFGIGVTNAVYYYFYSWSSDKARLANAGQLSVRQSILAGLVAGTATTLVTNPLWVVQTHQSTYTHVHPNSPPPSIPQSIAMIYSRKGLAGFWAGIKAALILVTNPVLQYTAFEQLKNLLIKRRMASGKIGVVSDFEVFILGALAKLFATSLSYPLVLLKSRLQSNTHAYPSISAALLSILKKEGPSGLYRGVQAKLLQSVLTASFLFLGQKKVSEMVRKILLSSAVAKA